MMERMMERTAYSKMENEGDRKTERPVERSIKRRFGKRMAGMLKTGLLFLPVLCLEGCAEAIPAGLGDSSLDGLSERSSCFTYYASACDDGDFQVKGRVYLHETNAGIVCITAEEDTEVDVQGSIKNAEGDVQLVFEAQDKTRTVIVDGENREVEEKVAVAEGKSEIYFTGEGSCEFKLEMTAGDKVSFDDGMEKPEPDSGAEGVEDRERDAGTEDAKDRKANVGAEDAQDWKSVVGTEDAEDQKQDIGMGLPDLDDMENGERAAFPGLTDNWPECIVLEDKGMSSSPLSVAFQVEKPMKIALSCMTTGGSLRVKIVNDGGQKVYFNKKDPEGDYEISVDEAGTCYMEIYAENHKGSIRIAPAQQ